MANLTRIKILTTGATTNAPTNIKTGELAYSYVSGTQANNGDRLYVGTGTESGGVSSSVDIIGGKYFTQLLDHVHGTATASSAVILDANKHLTDINIGTLTLESTGGSGHSVTNIINNAAGLSASDTSLASAQAIKTYVDTLVDAQDVDITTDSGTIAIDLDDETLSILGTTNEIETSAAGNTVTLGLPNSVTITTNLSVGGTLDVTGQTELASLNVEDLTNTRIVYAGADGELSDSANLVFNSTGLNIGSNKFTVAHATGNTLVAGTLVVNGNTTLGNATGDTVQTSGNLTVGGNLTVNGTTTSVNSTTTTLTDPVIELAKDTSSADGLDRGVRFKWHNGAGVKDGFFGLDIQTQRFVFTKDEDLSGGENASAPWSDAEFGNIYGTGADLGNIQIGITTDNEIDTVSGNLTLDSSGGTVIVDDILQVTGAASAASLTLSTDLAVAHGGTGLSSFTGKGVVGTNAGGSALTFLTSSLGTTGDMLQYNASGVPIVTNIIDGGTY